MSQLLFHPLTSQPILVSPERGERPGAWAQPTAQPGHGAATCPFCPGHEDETPPEIARRAGGKDWSARVVPNKYPALAPIAGYASHEVLIDSAAHDSPLESRGTADLERMVEQWRERYVSHVVRPEIESVIIFRNEGRAAGQSIAHPHSQLVALPFVPPRLEAEMRGFVSGACPLCAMQAGPDNERFAVGHVEGMTILVPAASRMPYELWIVPERHEPDWQQCAPAELAAALGLATRALRLRWPDAAFNVALSTAPIRAEGRDRFHWHVELLPRLTNLAGFELATDSWMNIVESSRAAAEMRSALAR